MFVADDFGMFITSDFGMFSVDCFGTFTALWESAGPGRPIRRAAAR